MGQAEPSQHFPTVLAHTHTIGCLMMYMYNLWSWLAAASRMSNVWAGRCYGMLSAVNINISYYGKWGSILHCFKLSLHIDDVLQKHGTLCRHLKQAQAPTVGTLTQCAGPLPSPNGWGRASWLMKLFLFSLRRGWMWRKK